MLNFWCILSPVVATFGFFFVHLIQFFSGFWFLFENSWANELQYTTPWPQIRMPWVIILTRRSMRMGQLSLAPACVGWLFIYVFNFLLFWLCFGCLLIILSPFGFGQFLGEVCQCLDFGVAFFVWLFRVFKKSNADMSCCNRGYLISNTSQEYKIIFFVCILNILSCPLINP